MSKTSLKFVRKGAQPEECTKFKPIGFCCQPKDYDPKLKYDQRKPPYVSSLTSIHSIHGSPVLQFEADYIDEPELRGRATKLKASISNDKALWKHNLLSSSLRGPIKWYIEDELALAKHTFWDHKCLSSNKEICKNIKTAKKRVRNLMSTLMDSTFPPWYQDFSIEQMQHLMSLPDVICTDYEEKLTTRTQEMLITIGITSTFFKLSPKTIRRIHLICQLNAVEFLREVYKVLTGTYFEDEGNKKVYDCNERIILSGIALLTLPETITELHKRLPAMKLPDLPPKPQPPGVKYTHPRRSPYNEDLFTPPNWALYRDQLQAWRDHCKLIPMPKAILPCEEYSTVLKCKGFIKKPVDTKDITDIVDNERAQYKDSISDTVHDQHIIDASDNTGDNYAEVEARLSDHAKKFDFTISGLSEKPGPVKYKIYGIFKPPYPNKKSWLGEQDPRYIVSGVKDSPPEGPVLYEMSGVANVTQNKSDERFFAVLKLGDGPKKIYPSGRKNLSKNWQEWLQNADEEFIKVETEANKMIKSIEATMKLVFPGPQCDSCCPCRQTKKTYAKWKETKAPHLVIDTVAEDSNKNKYIVGSMAMHSPAPSLTDLSINLLEVIASEDKVTTNVIINGVTNEKGETQYYITGHRKDKEHIPSKIMKAPSQDAVKDIPPCACAVQQIFNGNDAINAKDDIPWTKASGVCIGAKYRPKETPPFSCRQYPGDKSCRKNPFMKRINKLKRALEKNKGKRDRDINCDEQRQMYSIADFVPCGDQHKMATCGERYGTLNIFSPKELADQERIRKEILKGPPCGKKPGRAVCDAASIEAIPKQVKVGEDEEEEDEEAEAEEKVMKKEEISIPKPKPIKRDKHCYAVPEMKSNNEKVVRKSDNRFIPDTNYPGYDDPWNITRTAPSKIESMTNYERSLNLSYAQLDMQPTNAMQDTRCKTSKPKPVRQKMNRENRKEVDKNEMKSETNEKAEAISSNKNIDDQHRKGGKYAIYCKKYLQSQKKHPKSIKHTTREETRKRQMHLETPTQKSVQKGFSKNIQKGSSKNIQKGNRKSEKHATEHNLMQDRREQTEQLKKMMTLHDGFLNDVTPVKLPKEHLKVCKHSRDQDVEDIDIENAPYEAPVSQPVSTKKETCGWRTKSQQQLPPKENIAYLVEPDYPLEMVRLRPGGKPCICRETRNKKQILSYNIGGQVQKKTTDTPKSKQKKSKKIVKVDQPPTNVIEGVTYYTPPISPVRSREYVPEYDIFDSPYDMCLSDYKDANLRLIEQSVGSRNFTSQPSKNIEPCGCNYYIDTYGIVDVDYTMQSNVSAVEQMQQRKIDTEKFMKNKSQQEKWSIALKDQALLKRYAHDKRNTCCWRTCGKFARKPTGHSLKLKVKKPVCECRYERKILERTEDAHHWKNRQQKLKSFKKKAYTHVDNTSRPIETDTKLLISGVERIPREDEYVDDIKYCITGTVENYIMEPPEKVLDGVHMGTPCVTPVPSKKEILSGIHSHWSASKIAAGPLPRKDEALKKDTERRKQALMSAFHQIYGEGNKIEDSPIVYQNNEVSDKSPRTKRIGSSLEKSVDMPVNLLEHDQQDSNFTDNIHMDKKPYKNDQIVPKRKSGGESDAYGTDEKSGHKGSRHAKKHLTILMKIELAKMATEGFVFARLPKCYMMPQLKIWLAYRKGFIITDIKKKKLLQKSITYWNTLSTLGKPPCKVPPLNMGNSDLKNLTYDRVNQLKERVAAVTAKFYSDARKDRVQAARVFWNTMDYYKFPSISYKKTYFSYMPGKEADGHVFKPWTMI